MRQTKNKKLKELLNKPIDNNRVLDIGYEHATANEIDWFDTFLRNKGGVIVKSGTKIGRKTLLNL